MSLKLNSSGGGSITLQEPSTASNRTLTLPDNTGNLISSADSGTITQGMLASGVAGNGPAFSAYCSSATTLGSKVFTKVLFQTEDFDTNNNFASSRFTPTVAGYYQINCLVTSGTASSAAFYQVSIYKNGSAFKNGQISALSGPYGVSASSIIYLNGSTDYVEVYVYQDTAGTATTTAVQETTYFNGAMVRAA